MPAPAITRCIVSLTHEGDSLTLPINAEITPVKKTRAYNEVDILGYRTVGRIGNPGLDEVSIESFFPEKWSSLCSVPEGQFLEPFGYIDTIRGWMEEVAPKPVYTIISSIWRKWTSVVSFDYEERAGEVGDIYFTLTLREFVPLDPKAFLAPGTVSSGAGTSAPTVGATTASSSYTTVSGDTLWAIARRKYGDGNFWNIIYEANRATIGADPNLLRVGLLLLLPAR